MYKSNLVRLFGVCMYVLSDYEQRSVEGFVPRIRTDSYTCRVYHSDPLCPSRLSNLLSLIVEIRSV